MQEKGKFPSQTLPNPRGVHEVSSSSEPNPRMDEVKAIITLRTGKELKKLIPKLTEEGLEGKAVEPDEVVTKEHATKNSIPPPFLQALKAKKKAVNQVEILEVLRQVQFNIPLLDMIKQVPTYAKFLKDLCIVKRGLEKLHYHREGATGSGLCFEQVRSLFGWVEHNHIHRSFNFEVPTHQTEC